MEKISKFTKEDIIRFDRSRKSIEDWLRAWIMAENPQTPRLQRLIDLYEYVMMDDHLTGAIENRKLDVLSEKYVICNATGEPDEELTKLVRKTWFKELLALALDSIYYGHSLIELGDIEANNEIKEVTLIERRCVIPSKKMVTRTPGEVTGIDFTMPEIADDYIFVGKKKDLGLLLKAAPNVIYKRYAKAAWVEHAEVFNLPFLHAKTDLMDLVRKSNMVEALQEAGRERTMLTDLGDEVTPVPMSATDAYRIYLELEQSCNKGNSKLINGETMTMDEGSSRSQSETHEDTSDKRTKAYREMLEDLINEQVLEKLTNKGYPFADCTFKFDVTRQVPTTEKVSVYTMLLQYYDISEEQIQEEFGVEVLKKAEPEVQPGGFGKQDPKAA